MSEAKLKLLFLIAAIYDIVLGVSYFFAHERLFSIFGVPAAGHPTYIQFPALLLVLFGLMFLQVSKNPYRYRMFIPYGIGLKAAFSGLAFWYQFTVGVAFMWMPMATIDLLFLIAFVIAWFSSVQRIETA